MSTTDTTKVKEFESLLNQLEQAVNRNGENSHEFRKCTKNLSPITQNPTDCQEESIQPGGHLNRLKTLIYKLNTINEDDSDTLGHLTSLI